MTNSIDRDILGSKWFRSDLGLGGSPCIRGPQLAPVLRLLGWIHAWGLAFRGGSPCIHAWGNTLALQESNRLIIVRALAPGLPNMKPRG